MKAMEAELNMYKQQVDLFKSDIEAANGAMRALRHRWVADQRRANRKGGGDVISLHNSKATAWGSPLPNTAGDIASSLLPEGSDAISADNMGIPDGLNRLGSAGPAGAAAAGAVTVAGA